MDDFFRVPTVISLRSQAAKADSLLKMQTQTILPACGTAVTAHTLSLNGYIRRSETVFDETVHSPGQALFNIQKYGNSILAVTAVPPTLSGYSYTYHKYHIADGEVIEIAEGNTNTVYPW